MDISSKPRSSINLYTEGVSRALPVVFGYLPVGFAFGVLSQQAGLSIINTILMSLIVYAGSSQLIAIGLISSGAGALSIIFTTFIVNLRHFLMSAAISPYLEKWRKAEIAAFAYELTDETFAIHATRFTENKNNKTITLVINFTAHISWITGSWMGAVTGNLITDIKPFGLDFALPAMFIALLVIQLKNITQIIVAVVAGCISIALLGYGISQWHVILAAVFGATLGVVFEKWTKT